MGAAASNLAETSTSLPGGGVRSWSACWAPSATTVWTMRWPASSALPRAMGGAAGTTRITVELSAAELERLSLLAQELAASPSEALRQLASRGRQGWPWLLAIDLRHQARTLLMQKLRRRGRRVGFKLPRISDHS